MIFHKKLTRKLNLNQIEIKDQKLKIRNIKDIKREGA